MSATVVPVNQTSLELATFFGWARGLAVVPTPANGTWHVRDNRFGVHARHHILAKLEWRAAALIEARVDSIATAYNAMILVNPRVHGRPTSREAAGYAFGDRPVVEQLEETHGGDRVKRRAIAAKRDRADVDHIVDATA